MLYHRNYSGIETEENKYGGMKTWRKTGKYPSKRGCRGGLGACQSFVNMKVHTLNIHPFAANGHFSLYYRPFFSLSSYDSGIFESILIISSNEPNANTRSLSLIFSPTLQNRLDSLGEVVQTFHHVDPAE